MPLPFALQAKDDQQMIVVYYSHLHTPDTLVQVVYETSKKYTALPFT